MNSFERILVALSHDDFANAVFDRAVTLAHRYQSHLILTHCTSLKLVEHMGTFIDAGFGLVSSDQLQQLDEAHQDQVDEDYQWLCDYASIARAQGVRVKVIHQVGDACVQICRLARHTYADLIVIGRGQTSGVKRWLFGNQTDYVMHHAPCPVLVVQSDSELQSLDLQSFFDQTADRLYEHPCVNWQSTNFTPSLRSHTWN